MMDWDNLPEFPMSDKQMQDTLRWWLGEDSYDMLRAVVEDCVHVHDRLMLSYEDLDDRLKTADLAKIIEDLHVKLFGTKDYG